MDKASELFQALIFQLAQSAYVSMGKVPSPFSGEMERNIEVARLTIDTLEAIEARTQGNLTEEEKTVFERILRELRMNYLDEVKKEAEKTAGQSEKPEEKGAGEEPEGKKPEGKATEENRPGEEEPKEKEPEEKESKG